MPTPNPIRRKTVKFGVKCGEFALVYERIDENLKPAESLANLPFPNCANKCAAVEYLGVGECESVCPSKFKQLEEGGIDIYA